MILNNKFVKCRTLQMLIHKSFPHINDNLVEGESLWFVDGYSSLSGTCSREHLWRCVPQ